ncbi:hypothetical protein IW261DRAFT_1424890 [Armillaria novae-zelandiae]|uniref:Uncharacterized protein n=1 Tax=Armillaria novae-zelandiae TaxID=153914 RepID=A0AA39NTX4_9AGAR|nr:hypothetical protein IW261DRAFT_1424890 [Armillaria novae-zelandiae]
MVVYFFLIVSAFLDLEAGVSRKDEVDSLYENNDENFIAEEDDSDGTTNSMAFKVFGGATTSTIPDENQAWTSFLGRARSCANGLKDSLETDVRSNIRFDVPTSEILVLKCFCGWEESVVLHIGWCTRPELGIKAAFMMPLVEEKIWLEANVSLKLKDWLFDIPGVVHWNQQVLLHVISLEDSRHALASTVQNPFMPELKLFDATAIEKAGYRVGKDGASNYRFRGLMYDHDLHARRIYFSQMEIANEITEKLAFLFVWSGHPLVRRSIRALPRVSEWCFQVGEVVTDISRHISGTVHGVGEQGLEVEFANGLFSVRWADCKKEFEIGTYVEITGEEHATRWSGWIRGVHPNSVSAIALPNIATSIHLDSNSEHLNPIPTVPWKGVMVQVIKRGHCWHGKTGYVVDVNIVKDLGRKKEVLLFLVQLSHYDPNALFICLWFRYLDIIEEESWLPLNEACPIVTGLFRNLVPDTNVLGKRGRRLPPPEPAVRPRSVTPLLDPTEQCLSPAWNPSSLDPPPLKYWCLDCQLLDARFRMQYNNLKITALVKYDISLKKIVCIRDDTPLGTTLDPARVLAIHPKIRHYDMFLVISGEHCGKWVRSIRFHKCSPTETSDLDWTVVVVIPRAPFMHDDVTDETLVLHSSTMTIADETKISQQLNLDLRKRDEDINFNLKGCKDAQVTHVDLMANSTSTIDSANGPSTWEEGHPDAVDEMVPALLIPQNEIDTDGGKKETMCFVETIALVVRHSRNHPMDTVLSPCNIELTCIITTFETSSNTTFLKTFDPVASLHWKSFPSAR